jgi:hypothetical protein
MPYEATVSLYKAFLFNKRTVFLAALLNRRYTRFSLKT